MKRKKYFKRLAALQDGLFPDALGKERTMSSGLMRAFAKPSRSADAINDEALSNFRPLNIRLAIQSESAVMPQCRRK